MRSMTAAVILVAVALECVRRANALLMGLAGTIAAAAPDCAATPDKSSEGDTDTVAAMRLLIMPGFTSGRKFGHLLMLGNNW